MSPIPVLPSSGVQCQAGMSPWRQWGCLSVLPHPCAALASYEAHVPISHLGTDKPSLVGVLTGKYFLLNRVNLASPVLQGPRAEVCSIFFQFPFCQLPLSSPDLVGAAPADVRWTCLVLDLHSILSLYLNRRYSHLKSVKLCSNLLVKNLCTSDLVFDPGEELRPRGGLWFLL